MGYLPIIITLSCFIGLFFLVVNQSLMAKKKSILQIQQAFFNELEKLETVHQKEVGLNPQIFKKIDEQYAKTKAENSRKSNSTFETEVRPIFHSLKITISQYNKLIEKKPYSFVAQVMGHRHLG